MSNQAYVPVSEGLETTVRASRAGEKFTGAVFTRWESPTRAGAWHAASMWGDDMHVRVGVILLDIADNHNPPEIVVMVPNVIAPATIYEIVDRLVEEAEDALDE